MKKILNFILVVLISISCTDVDLKPLDAQSELNYWQTQEDATTFLNSMYADLMSADNYLFFNAISDDAYSKSNEDYRNIANGNYDATNGTIRAQWSGRYQGIRRCNIFLNNISRVQGITDQIRNPLIGQARFIRAWHYFYLSQLFGDVPLVKTEISIEESQTLTRTAKSAVNTFIDEELAAAIETLPESYPPDQLGRITKGAAIAFKSRFHLYNNQYEESAALAGELFGKYSLFPNYAGLFKTDNEYNKEVILDLQYAPTTREHNLQYNLIPPSESGYASFSPLQELIDAYPMMNGLSIDNPLSGYDENNPYQNRDPRLAASVVYDEYSWTSFNGSQITIDTSPGAAPNGLNYSSNSTPTGYYVSKYYDRSARNLVNSGLNLILIRFAEVLLNYAEAKISLGTFTAADWENTIKLIRQRAGLSGPDALNFPETDQASLLEIVRNERRVELAFEAGHRFFDIRRGATAEEVLNGWAHGMKTNVSMEDNGFERVDFRTFDPAKHYLWPIPQSERDLNNSLSQNPKW